MPFKKGQSGNAKGRPKKGTALADLLRKQLADTDENGLTNREVIIAMLITMARFGDLDAIKVVLDRVDGKVVEKKEVTGKDGGPIETKTQVVIYMPENGRDGQQDGH